MSHPTNRLPVGLPAGMPRPGLPKRLSAILSARLLAAIFCALTIVVLWQGISDLSGRRFIEADASWREHVTPLESSPAAPGVARVQAGVYVMSVSSVAPSTGTYTVDMYVMLRCATAPCEFGKWEFMNGRAKTTELNVDQPLYKEYRIQADLQTPPDLRKYPFDSLPIRVAFEDSARDETKMVYVADPKLNLIDPAVNLAGWKLVGWKAGVGRHHYPHWDTTYSRFAFEMLLGRSPLSAVLKSIAPAMVIVVSGLLGLLLGPKHVLQRITIGTSSLIAAIMFHINLTSQLPPIGYLTFADKFMLLNYLALVSALSTSILLYARQGDPDSPTPPGLLNVHRITQACVPIGWLTAMVALVHLGA